MPTKDEQQERKKFMKSFLRKLFENLEGRPRTKTQKRINKIEYLKEEYRNKKNQYAPNFVQRRVEQIFNSMTSEEKKGGQQGIINILYNRSRGQFPQSTGAEALANAYGRYIAEQVNGGNIDILTELNINEFFNMGAFRRTEQPETKTEEKQPEPEPEPEPKPVQKKAKKSKKKTKKEKKEREEKIPDPEPQPKQLTLSSDEETPTKTEEQQLEEADAKMAEQKKKQTQRQEAMKKLEPQLVEERKTIADINLPVRIWNELLEGQRIARERSTSPNSYLAQTYALNLKRIAGSLRPRITPTQLGEAVKEYEEILEGETAPKQKFIPQKLVRGKPTTTAGIVVEQSELTRQAIEEASAQARAEAERKSQEIIDNLTKQLEEAKAKTKKEAKKIRTQLTTESQTIIDKLKDSEFKLEADTKQLKAQLKAMGDKTSAEAQEQLLKLNQLSQQLKEAQAERKTIEKQATEQRMIIQKQATEQRKLIINAITNINKLKNIDNIKAGILENAFIKKVQGKKPKSLLSKENINMIINNVPEENRRVLAPSIRSLFSTNPDINTFVDGIVGLGTVVVSGNPLVASAVQSAFGYLRNSFGIDFNNLFSKRILNKKENNNKQLRERKL